MLGSLCVYASLLIFFVGVASFIRPLTVLRIADRRRAAAITLGGLVLLLIAFVWPAHEARVATVQSQLDRFMPVYQFHEFHSIRVAAPKERVYRAIKEVTASEILFFRTLTWIRRFGRPGPASIVHAPEQQPLLEVAMQTSFLLLAEEPDHEIVLGTLVLAPPGWQPKSKPSPEDFKALQAPGFALAAMNFRLEDAGPGACVFTTETRVYATDAVARRTFARYWRVIYPGSALIRRMWLRAIQRRAEAEPE